MGEQHRLATLLQPLGPATNGPRRPRPAGSALSRPDPSASTRSGTRAGAGRRSCGRSSARSHSRRRSCRSPGTTPPTATITRRAVNVESGSLTVKPESPPDSLADPLDLEHRALAAQTRSDRSSRRHQRIEYVGRPVRHREDLAVASILVATPASSNIRTVASTSSRRRAGPRNAPLSPNACWMARMPRRLRGVVTPGRSGPTRPRAGAGRGRW